MDLIQLKIKEDISTIKYIKIIRKFDSSLSISAIKQSISENDFVLSYDLDLDYDVLEDINEITCRKKSFHQLFRAMIQELIQAGAQISIYQNGEFKSIKFLDNWLKTIDDIKQETQYDIDRELEQ